MAQTSKLISTISFNTPNFLLRRLHELQDKGVIEYAHWIWHKPEQDETKNHAHVLVKPNRRLDTSALRNEFKELLVGEDKPRGVLPFRPTSRVSDWLLYSAHDSLYLARKGEARVEHYEKVDFKSTDEDLLEEDWRDCHRTDDSKLSMLKDMVRLNKSWPEVLEMGFLPINQLFQYREIFFALLQHATDRGGRVGHDE